MGSARVTCLPLGPKNLPENEILYWANVLSWQAHQSHKE